MTTETEVDHAVQNCEGHLESMLEAYQGYNALESKEVDEVRIDGEVFTDPDMIRERMQESALDVSVRSGWYSPGTKAEPEEFLILLSTGGPALRIIGDLDRGSPSRARIQYQDWGTPWTEYLTLTDDEREALEWFVNTFYFGE